MVNLKQLVLLSTLLFLSSCDFLQQIQLPRQDFTCKIESSSANQSDKKRKSESLDLELVIDATPSMQGFVGNNRQSQYEKTLQLLLQAVDAGWAQGRSQIKYYRFGTVKEEIQRTQYINAQKKDFYAGGGAFSDGQLKAAIPAAADSKVSVIVTDLYQTNNDITETVRFLKENYLQQNYAVGVLGIKSDFSGTVYDIGITRAQRRYDTQGKNNEMLRPFYVVFLGTHANVAYLFSQLKEKGQDLFADQQFNIFSLNFLERISAFDLEKHPAEFPKNRQVLKSAATLSNGQVKSRLVDKSQIASFRISNQVDNLKTKDPYQIRYQVPFYLLPNTLEIDDSQAKAFITKQTLRLSERNGSKVSFTDVNAQPMILSNWKMGSDSQKLLGFTAEVDPNTLKPGIYQLEIDLVPNRFREPSWWQQWNFDEANFDRVREANFEGSKTLNLLLFLQGLKSSTSELITTSQTKSARLCFAIQKDR